MKARVFLKVEFALYYNPRKTFLDIKTDDNFVTLQPSRHFKSKENLYSAKITKESVHRYKASQ